MFKIRLKKIVLIVSLLIILSTAIQSSQTVEVSDWESFDVIDEQDIEIYTSDEYHVLSLELKLETEDLSFPSIWLVYESPDGEGLDLIDTDEDSQTVEFIASSATLEISGEISGEYRVHEYATGVNGVVENIIANKGIPILLLLIFGLPIGVTLIFVVGRRIRVGRM